MGFFGKTWQTSRFSMSQNALANAHLLAHNVWRAPACPPWFTFWRAVARPDFYNDRVTFLTNDVHRLEGSGAAWSENFNLCQTLLNPCLYKCSSVGVRPVVRSGRPTAFAVGG